MGSILSYAFRQTFSEMHRLITISMIFLSGWLSLHGQTETVPVDLQVPLLLKAMKFERNFENKLSGSPKEVVIGVVYQEKLRRSFQSRNAFAANIQKLSFDIPIRLVLIPLNEDNSIPEMLDWSPLTILYITPMRGVDIVAITDKTRENGVISSSGIPLYGDKGVTLTFDLEKDRPKFVINRSSAEAEECDFSAQLLKLAIIR